MKFAVITLYDKPVTALTKGGTEKWTYDFIMEASKRGHTIDLYAAPGSVRSPSIHLIPHDTKSYDERMNDPYFQTMTLENRAKYQERLLGTLYTRAIVELNEHEHEYDAIIDSLSYPYLMMSSHLFVKPILTIRHMSIDAGFEFYHILSQYKGTVVFPSQFQYKKAGFIDEDHKAVIQHGIHGEDFLFNKNGGQDIVWMSRIDSRMDKGSREVIEVAKTLGKKAKLFGVVDTAMESFFEVNIKSALSTDVTFNRLTIDQVIDKNEIFGNSKVFLFPIKWEEPFGLVITEALATGTPVISFARGAASEIIEDGVTGYIVNSSPEDIRGSFKIKKTGIEGLKEAVQKIYDMPDEKYYLMRKACRESVQSKFSVKRMFDDYESLIKKITQATNSNGN